MTTKEKAKAYDEAIEIAKTMIDDLRKGEDILSVSNLEAMFPELAESEDERIRKALIHLVNSNKELSFGIDNYDGIKWSDILAWLEKQGEQPKKHDVCDNCDQQGGCVSPCPMKLVEKHGEQ